MVQLLTVVRPRIAIVDAHELVVAGLSQFFNEDASRRYCVVSLTPRDGVAPDVVLYGVERGGHHDVELHALLRTISSTILVTYWEKSSPAVDLALACGAHGAVSLERTPDTLIREVDSALQRREPARRLPEECWHPDIAQCGLTRREVEVLRLIRVGSSNQEIADRLYISVNSVKSYLRHAYAKIGVHRRTQAVLWAQRHGLTPPGAGYGRQRGGPVDPGQPPNSGEHLGFRLSGGA